MEKMLYLMPDGFGSLQIKNGCVEGFGCCCNEARFTAVEITEAEKGRGGSLL